MKFRRKNRFHSAAFVATGFALTLCVSQAAALWWDGSDSTANNASDNATTTGQSWLSGGNWDSGTSSNNSNWVDGSDAIFGGTATSQTITAGTLTVGNLTFGQGAQGAGTTGTGYTINGGTITLAGSTITTNTATTISSLLTGTTGLTKSGAGTLTLTGSNNFTGNVVIDQGILVTASAEQYATAATTSALGNPSTAGRTVTINNSGTLQFGGANQFGGPQAGKYPNIGLVINAGGSVLGFNGNMNTLGAVTLNGGTLTTNNGYNSTNQSFYITGLVTVGGSAASTISAGGTTNNGIHLASSTTFDVADATGNANADLTVSVALMNRPSNDTGGAAAVTKTGAGTMVLSGANTYSGGTKISAGTLSFANGSLGTAGTITMDGGTLQWNGSNSQDISGRLTMVAAKNATFDINGNSVTFGTAIGSGTTGSLTKIGAGRLTLSGTNTYTGATTVNGGTLNVIGTLSTSNVTVNNGGTLSGAGSTLGSLTLASGSTIIGAAGTAAGSNGAGFTVGALDTSAGGINVLGSVSGSGSLDIVRYTGTWTGDPSNFNLSAFRSGASVSTIAAATGNKLQLQISSLADTWAAATGTWDNSQGAGVWTNGSDNKFYSADTVQFGNVSGQSAATVTIGASVIPNAVIFNGAATNYTLGGLGSINGSAALTVNAAGTNVTLNNANAYIGGTTITAGTLSFANGSLGSAGTITMDGGTLQWATGNTQDVSGRLALNATGSSTFDTNGNNVTLASAFGGLGGLTKTGLGTLTLSGANTYTGNVVINQGTLLAQSGNKYSTLATTSALGNPSTADRTVTINNGGTLQFGNGNEFGGPQAGKYPVIGLVINQGGSVIAYSGDLNTLGAVTLNGGTLTTNTGLDGNNPSFFITGGVTVGGTTASNISAGGGANNGISLADATTFNVADATGDANADLTVSAALLNRSGNAGSGSAVITKTGAGTMVLSGTNTYSGTTSVSQGTLKVTGSIGNSAVTVSNVGSVLASGVTGTIGSRVTINNGAILAAGDSGTAGTATVTGAVTMNNGSIFSWDISGNGASYDKLVAGSLAGEATAGDAVFRIVAADSSFSDTFWTQNRTWTDIFTTNGTAAITNWASLFSVSVVNSSFQDLTPVNGSFSISGNTLTWSAVPEPTSALAGLLIGAGLFRRRRMPTILRS